MIDLAEVAHEDMKWADWLCMVNHLDVNVMGLIR
jgi:hypothetical protein